MYEEGECSSDKKFFMCNQDSQLYKFLKEKQNEYTLAKQVLRSGTSIGALIRESENAESIKDFIHKLNIALKEADETQYWLELLFATKFINEEMYESFNKDAEELVKLLISSLKTSKSNFKNVSQ